MTKARMALAAGLAAATMLAGCNAGGEEGDNALAGGNAAAVTEPGRETVAAALAGDGDLARLGEIVRNAGFDTLLGGTGPYTVFAPGDDAVAALGDARTNGLKGEAMRPQAIALLRAHIVPGVVTRRDIEAALQQRGSRPVTMGTMSGSPLTFSREGDAIVVTGLDGTRARLVEETLASNGAIQRVDALLVPVEAAGR